MASPETVDRVVNLALAWRIAKEKRMCPDRTR
jgi:hypothetical protein